MKLDAVRRFALSLAGTIEAPHFDYTSFRVNGRIYATAPPSGLHLHVFLDEEQRETALAIAPDIAEKLFWGARAIGVRVHLAAAKPTFVHGLLRQAWARRAPPAKPGRSASAKAARRARPGTGAATGGPSRRKRH